ncbi:MAG: hypothetical protein ACMUIP_06790 [bacterium]
MRDWVSLILTVVFSLLLTLFVYSDNIQAKEFSMRVSLSVNGQKDLCEVIRPYMIETLNTLHDVEVVDDDFDWLIGIIVQELSTNIGYKTGVVFSGVVIKASNGWYNSLNGEEKEITPELTATLHGCEGHWLRVGAKKEIKEICREIIKNFDRDYLEKDRKFFFMSREIRKFR